MKYNPEGPHFPPSVNSYDMNIMLIWLGYSGASGDCLVTYSWNKTIQFMYQKI